MDRMRIFIERWRYLDGETVFGMFCAAFVFMSLWYIAASSIFGEMMP